MIPVERFVFSEKSKSQLAWDFVGLIETGRYKEYVDPAPVGSAQRMVTEAFWAELKGIEFAVAAGPGQAMRWGASGRGHDDLVMSAALVARLESVRWQRRIARGVEGGWSLVVGTKNPKPKT